MTERYSRFYSLPTNLYVEGSPVMIAAGALVKDTKDGGVIGQLKFRSISDKEISTITVGVRAYDSTGKDLGEELTHQYFDISLSRDQTGGGKEAIKFPDSSTKSFKAYVKEVVFADRALWASENEEWESIPAQVAFIDTQGDKELAHQYELHYGNGAVYAFRRYKDLWNCACGAVNRAEEEYCHSCRVEISDLENLSLDQLRQEMEERLTFEEKERERRAEEERIRKEEEEKRKKEDERARAIEAAERAKRVKKNGIIVALLLIVCIIGGLLYSNYSKKKEIEEANALAYSEAEKLLEEEKYDEAADAFTALGDYKDSKDRAAEAVQLKDESRKNNPYLRITDYILANGKESEVEGFAGKTLRYDALGAEANQFTTYLGADPANPELIYVLQKYLGPEEQFKELQFNMNLDGQSLKYELAIPLKREYDALIFKESGTVAMATYNYGDIITYDTIDDTELKKENVVDFVDRQDIKELPTSYVNNLVSVLNIAIYDYDFGVTMQELGFEKLDAVSKEKYEELKENYLKSNN